MSESKTAYEATSSTFATPSGIRVGYETYGEGPPLVLIHGAFSDHQSNWGYVKPLLAPHFSVHAMARRGRGATASTTGHGLNEEAQDAAALIRMIGGPVYLLGHSYGAHVALGAALEVPSLVRKLVLYEPAWPNLLDEASMDWLEGPVAAEDWDGFATTFFGRVLEVPADVLEAVRHSDDWPPILADAPATIGDLRALRRHHFDPERYGAALTMPVLLQVGTESPRDFYVTDALAAVLADVKIGELEGQAHEGMTTAPEQYAESVCRFLRG